MSFAGVLKYEVIVVWLLGGACEVSACYAVGVVGKVAHPCASRCSTRSFAFQMSALHWPNGPSGIAAIAFSRVLIHIHDVFPCANRSC